MSQIQSWHCCISINNIDVTNSKTNLFYRFALPWCISHVRQPGEDYLRCQYWSLTKMVRNIRSEEILYVWKQYLQCKCIKFWILTLMHRTIEVSAWYCIDIVGMEDLWDVTMIEVYYPILSHKIEIFHQIFHLVMNEWLQQQ